MWIREERGIDKTQGLPSLNEGIERKHRLFHAWPHCSLSPRKGFLELRADEKHPGTGLPVSAGDMGEPELTFLW